jgi:hypothetical protein
VVTAHIQKPVELQLEPVQYILLVVAQNRFEYLEQEPVLVLVDNIALLQEREPVHNILLQGQGQKWEPVHNTEVLDWEREPVLVDNIQVLG